MLDIELIRTEPEKIRQALTARNLKPNVVDDFLAVDGEWRQAMKEGEVFRAELNKLSKERKVDEAKAVKEKLKKAEADLPELEKKRDALLDKFPNVSDPKWPVGKNADDNKVLRTVGEKPVFDFTPKDYLTLGKELSLIDIERASKVVGTRFGYIMGDLVLMEFALVQLAMETLLKEGFIPVLPPVMLKPEVYRAIGRLAHDQELERYRLAEDDLFLAGSSEHTLVPMHMDEVMEEKALPRRYAGFSTCFRREAGSYGKDTKGILRVHQFDKVEMISFTKPEDSEKEHQFLLSLQEKLMKALELPYQVVQNCTGDMGWTDYAQYDIEAWIPSEQKYRETQSCSNTTDFQTRGANIKIKANSSKLKPIYAHALNATGIAMARTLIAIIENYQTKKGTVMIPKALQKYCGKKEIASRNS